MQSQNEKNNEYQETIIEGQIVYFLISGYVFHGKIINIRHMTSTTTFEIEGYGGCGGNHIIDASQLHHTIFLSEAEALKYQDYEEMHLGNSC